MRRSASRLWNSIISIPPRGKALSARPGSMWRSRAAARRAASRQPSKGTCRMAASINLSCSSPALCIFSILRRALAAIDPLHFLHEHELGKVGHAHGIEDPIEVIAFVLYHPGMKAACLALDGAALERETAIADPRM